MGLWIPCLVLVVVLQGSDVLLVFPLVLKPLLTGLKPLVPQTMLLQLQTFLKQLAEHLRKHTHPHNVKPW